MVRSIFKVLFTFRFLGKKTIVVDINSGSTAHVLGHIQMVRSIFIVLFTFRFLIEAFDLVTGIVYTTCALRILVNFVKVCHRS